MTDALTLEDLSLLDELAAETIEPVEPPPAVRSRVLAAVRETPHVPGTTVRAEEGSWRPTPCRGVDFKKLSSDRRRNTVTILMRFAPGATFVEHDHRGAEDSYVVSGSCRIGEAALYAGDFHHVEPGEHHGAIVSDEGCLLLLVMDHADYHAA